MQSVFEFIIRLCSPKNFLDLHKTLPTITSIYCYEILFYIAKNLLLEVKYIDRAKY